MFTALLNELKSPLTGAAASLSKSASGDGYRRDIQTGKVLIRGKAFPIAGAICMDQLMTDIGKSEAYVGEEAVLIGKQGNEDITLWELARSSGAIPYEILTGFSHRLPRVYL